MQQVRGYIAPWTKKTWLSLCMRALVEDGCSSTEGKNGRVAWSYVLGFDWRLWTATCRCLQVLHWTPHGFLALAQKGEGCTSIVAVVARSASAEVSMTFGGHD